MIKKGVILAGGTGSRLFPSTKVTNKHLLPVYDRPMIYYGIDVLKKAGIQEIMIVSGTDHAGDFMRLLGSGLGSGVHLTFRVQDGAAGIADALLLAENFAGSDNLAVLLGDNIFADDLSESISDFKKGAQVFLKEVEDPQRFGVAQMRNEKVVSIEEKPEKPKSSLAVTGAYLFDNTVFNKIKNLKPSKRGEFEITDVLNVYIKESALKASLLKKDWTDAGTHDSLLKASEIAKKINVGRKSFINENTNKNSNKTDPKVTIGILAFDGEKYYENCFNSLFDQDYENIEILVLDNASPKNDSKIIKEKFGDKIKVIRSEKNLGFAGGHNFLIREMSGEFYLCLNQDMIFESNFVSELIKAIEKNPRYGSATGKIKRLDFEYGKPHKTNFIDTVGIKAFASHKFEDEGQGEMDEGQYEEEKEIFAASGSAIMFRKKALDDVAFTCEDGTKEYFDELFFMYKEDIDIGYRLQWSGWKCAYTPKALAYHDRTVAKKGSGISAILKQRKNRPSRIREWSWLNHHILLKKNFSEDFSFSTKLKFFWYEVKTRFWVSFFEREILQSWKTLGELSKKIDARKRQIKKVVAPSEVEKYFQK